MRNLKKQQYSKIIANKGNILYNIARKLINEGAYF